MKHIILILLVVLTGNPVYGQQIDSTATPVFEKEELLSRSKRQKTIGWIMFGTGAPIVLTSVYLLAAFDKNDVDKPVITTVLIASTLYTLISIPIISAGNRNKRKALEIQLTKNKIFVPALYSAGFKNQTAIRVVIPL